ncbi:MAG: hypothetical protein ACRC9K_09895 [Afipia sp.]
MFRLRNESAPGDLGTIGCGCATAFCNGSAIQQLGSISQEFIPRDAHIAQPLLRQTGAAKNALAIAVMLHLRAPYVSKTAILGCWVDRSGQKSKSRLNSKDLDRLVSS